MIKYSMYMENDSFFHRIDPRVKIFISFFILLTGILFTEADQLFVIFVSVFLMLRFGAKVPVRTFMKYIKPILPIVVILLVMWPFFESSGNVLVEFWKIKITDDGILIGVAMALRILTMISATFVLLTTTQQKDIISALTTMGMPYEYGLTLVIALRYIPTLAGMAQTIMDAQRSRGLELDKGNVMSRIRKYVPILAPLIVGAIRMAQELAIAIDSRAFGHGKRTYINTIKMSGKDWTVMALAVALFASMVYLRFWGTPSELAFF
ncbi:MAG TPA: energy-coupling factor transporter transmembrane component T [Candidatus Methanofastidiosa archaeon]|nr:energy-coupling factor transporter transmembrane component T [Candidatus Methanofastidiosa archaeon]